MRPGILPLLAAVALALVPAAPGYANHVFVVYMSPAGSNGNSGLSPAEAVTSLERVQDILHTTAPDSDVEVRIAQGTYVAGETEWVHFIPGHTITFMPADYSYGDGLVDIAGRPVFRSDGSTGWWMDARLPSGHPGGTTGLRFYYLQVESYGEGGLRIHGRYDTVNGFLVPTTLGANGNTIVGMYFWKLGSVWGNGPGFAALDLVNSSDNLIRANHFRYLENTEPDVSRIHGVYAAHGSSRNQIINNKFYKISGQPVRTRNMSNDNDFGNNTMELTSNSSHYGEWFCAEVCQATMGTPLECASQGNYYHHNDQISHYYETSQWTWRLTPDGQTYPGPAGCPALTAPRVRTLGNL